jgi:hypothetical protein
VRQPVRHGHLTEILTRIHHPQQIEFTGQTHTVRSSFTTRNDR